MKYSKAIVAIVIALNVLFTVAVLVLSWFGDEVPEELISRWFIFTGTELLALAGIKIGEMAQDTLKEKYDQLARGDTPNKSDMESDE